MFFRLRGRRRHKSGGEDSRTSVFGATQLIWRMFADPLILLTLAVIFQGVQAAIFTGKGPTQLQVSVFLGSPPLSMCSETASAKGTLSSASWGVLKALETLRGYYEAHTPPSPRLTVD